MILNRIFAISTFKFYLVYATVVGVSAFAILAVIYVSFSYEYFNEVHGAIIEEVDSAAISYQQGNMEGFERFVEQRTQPGSFNKFYYLLVDDQYTKLAGNLDEWPKFQTYGDGWLSFERGILQSGDVNEHDFVGRSKLLDNGYHLLAARHYNDVIEKIELVGGTLSQSMAVTIFLGALGGAFISAWFQRRLDAVNHAIQAIMSGDLSERIPVDSRSSDFEYLIENLNQMLDQIEYLMTGVRQVSDNIAHDLRTPLTRLRNNLATLERQAEPSQLGLVLELVSEADHLLATFNALLRIAQVESGHRRSGFSDVSLNTILADVAELYEPLAADKSITLKCNVAEDEEIRSRLLGSESLSVSDHHFVLSGDRDLLFQMAANLVDNAIKYTPAGGEVEVNLDVTETKAVISVLDSGMGIPDVCKKKVFQRFFRVEKSRSVEPGNGLGLSLVWAVVKLHGGEIELADNQGNPAGQGNSDHQNGRNNTSQAGASDATSAGVGLQVRVSFSLPLVSESSVQS
jgi:signal transduction histidine kinase